MIMDFHNHQTRRITSSKQRLQSLTSNLPRFSLENLTIFVGTFHRQQGLLELIDGNGGGKSIHQEAEPMR